MDDKYQSGLLDNMKIQNPKRLRIEDFTEEEREMISKIAFVMNSSFSSLFDLANKRITLRENISASVREFNVTVDAQGNPRNAVFLNLDDVLANQLVEGVQVIDAYSTDGVTRPTAGVFVDWSPNKSGININFVKGIPENKEFTIKLVIYN